MQPDVSFVIAAYNAEGSIARAVTSALGQRGVAVEVVVIDDCSSDRTVETARAISDERVRVIALDKNSGPGGARNAGLAAAQGRWIAVLDADDTVHPDRLALLIARAQGAGAQIVVDNLAVVTEPPSPVGAEFRDGDVAAAPANTSVSRAEPMFPLAVLEKHAEITLADFIAANLMFESTFSFGYMKPVIERRFVEDRALTYPETLRIGEDYIFLASAMATGARCVVEPQPLYQYHIRAGSISRVLELHHVEAMLAADGAFLRTYQLDPAARAAQARRTRSLEEAAAFLTLIGHIKAGAPLKAIGAALGRPRAIRHLRMPIAAKLKRLIQPFEAIGQSA